MKTWSWLGPVLAWLFTCVTVGFFAYQIGHTNGRYARVDECVCGQTQTCAFGPGIVGEQSCRTGFDQNKWTRCEPVPVKP